MGVQTVQKFVDVPQVQYVDRVVDVPVVKQVEIPQTLTVERLVEVPSIQTVEKIVEVPVTNTLEGETRYVEIPSVQRQVAETVVEEVVEMGAPTESVALEPIVVELKR